MILYTVDRHQTLETGMIIEKTTPQNIGDFSFLDILGFSFAEGVTKHGSRFLFDDISQTQNWKQNCFLELIFEIVRKECFPEKHSRFESIFCLDTVEQSYQFLKIFCNNQYRPIYKIETNTFLKLDMKLIAYKHNLAETFKNAHDYWLEKSSSEPIWEYLVKCPAEVGSKVN